MPARQRYRLRARSDREIIHEAQPGKRYVDHETGEELRVVSAVLPLAPSPSNLPYSIDNLRLCGCSLEQLVQKDLNDCPHCGRRLPAVERQSSSPSGSPSQQPAAAATASQPTDPPSHQS